MRYVALLSCLVVAGAIAVYGEGASKGASRVTEYPHPARPVMTHSIVNEEQVGVWVRAWQRRLGLEDWVIETRIVRSWNLPKGTVANIHWSLPKRRATIKVLDSVDSNLPRQEIVKDTELSVVHELVHLSMAKLPLDSSNTELEEEAVKKLSLALLELDKKDQE